MTLSWRRAGVELVDGYTVIGAHARPTATVVRARVAIEGGFLHIDIDGAEAIQIVSAPAVKRLTYLL